MTISTRILLSMALLVPGCGPGNGDEADGDADADADADGDVNCGGTDTLDVKVVRDHAPFADDEPRPGATVVVDCAAGRLRATTDEQGMAHFAGLDFANDPPDVSAVVPGLVMRTRASLGHDGEEVPRPFVFDFPEPEGGDSSWPWYTTAQRVTGQIVRTTPASKVYCWCDAAFAWPRQHTGGLAGYLDDATEYRVAFFDELAQDGPARAACVEYDQAGDAGPRTLLGFGEIALTGPGDGPPIELHALDPAEVERLDVPIRHIGGDQDPFLADRELHAFIDDQDADGYGVTIGLLESTERVGDVETLHLAWIPGAAVATPALTLVVRAEDGARIWGVTNLPVAELTDMPFPVEAPPTLEIAQDGANRTLRSLDADWAHDGLVVLSRLSQEYWRIIVPAGLGDWTMPAPPDDGEPPSLDMISPFVAVYRYDEAPPADDMIADWTSLHLREFAVSP